MSLVHRFKRDEESYDLHQEKIANCGVLYAEFYRQKGLFTDRAFIPIRCGSNYCEKCRKANIYKLRNLIHYSILNLQETWRFLTLTYDPKIKPIEDQYKDVSKMWDRLSKRLNRSVDNLKWIRSVELQSSGNIHIHAIVNKFLDNEKLIKDWTDLGGGSIEISLAKPKCKNHSRVFCAECYPAQWSHIGECQNHYRKFCPECYPYLKKCIIHRRASCSICFPKNCFDVSKYAANYLTIELVKSKKYQDPYRTGLSWWLARRRSISTSRTIKLVKDYTDTIYSFKRTVGTLEEVEATMKFYSEDNRKEVSREGKMFIVTELE
jgi:hypothetical protein